MPDEPEVYTSYMMVGEKKLYFSGRRLSTKGGKEFCAIMTKDGRISRGVDRAYVESFGNRPPLGRAVEAAFQDDINNGNLIARIMDRELADAM